MILAVDFSMKHVKPEICDLGLETMVQLLKLVSGADSVRDPFFKLYFSLILDNTLFVMTD